MFVYSLLGNYPALLHDCVTLLTVRWTICKAISSNSKQSCAHWMKWLPPPKSCATKPIIWSGNSTVLTNLSWPPITSTLYSNWVKRTLDLLWKILHGFQQRFKRASWSSKLRIFFRRILVADHVTVYIIIICSSFTRRPSDKYPNEFSDVNRLSPLRSGCISRSVHGVI